MALGKPLGDFSAEFNLTYNITLDLSNWDKTTIQVIAPFTGALVVYGSNDAGATAYSQGNAELAINFQAAQVTNLATGTATGSISSAGLYKYDVNAQFMRLQGTPAAAGTNIYRLNIFNSKIS